MVVDSSVALTWCFEDEQTPSSLVLLEAVVEAGAVAPSLWPLEVLNALIMAERRKRVDAAQRQRLSGFLRDLPIALDDETAAQAWSATLVAEVALDRRAAPATAAGYPVVLSYDFDSRDSPIPVRRRSGRTPWP